MRKIIVQVINFYQIIISTFLKSALGIKASCRYEITCSEYAKKSIMEKGVIKGGYFALIRILSCQPFSIK